MPVSASDLLKKLFAKAGIQYDGDLTADIPDDIAASLDNGLLTLQAATNNHPQVKKVYFAQAFDGLDAELNSLISEMGIPDEVKAEIEKAGGTTKRAAALVRKIKELSSKDQPADKTKAAELQAEINKLHGQLNAELAAKDQIKQEYADKLKAIQIQTKLSGMLGNYKTVFDDLDPAAKEAGINAIITKALQDSDADFTFDDKGNLSLMKKDGTNLFGENHTLVTPQSFIDKSLSKILKVTNGANGANGERPPAAPIQGTQRNDANPALKAAIAESAAAFAEASKVTL